MHTVRNARGERLDRLTLDDLPAEVLTPVVRQKLQVAVVQCRLGGLRVPPMEVDSLGVVLTRVMNHVWCVLQDRFGASLWNAFTYEQKYVLTRTVLKALQEGGR